VEERGDVTTSPCPIEIDRVCGGEVLLALSVTVTAKLKGLPASVVGAPLITPVVAFRFSPGGNDPDVTVHVV
jgi:hypothetical protein